MDLVNRFSVDRPAADVFAYLAAFGRTPEWNRAVHWSRQVTAGPVRQGTVFEETRNTARGVHGETFNVVEFDANRRLGVAAADGSDFRWEYRLEEHGARTTVTTLLTIPLARRLPVLEPLLRPIARRRFADNMRRLEILIAGGPGLGIDALEKVRLGDIDLWILARGRDRSKPVVLVIGQGPGLPTINEARDLRRLLGLENDHVVVYWDQRGCGRSTMVPVGPITVEQMRDDAAALIETLCERFATPTILVVGYSQGGAIAALAATVVPDRIGGLVLVSPDLRVSEADEAAYAFALREATARNNAHALRDLERVGPPPHVNARQFIGRARWVADFGGVLRAGTYRSYQLTLFRQLATSRAYSPLGLVRVLRAIPRTQDALLPDLARVDAFDSVPSLDVPLAVFVGRHDRVAPPAIAERYVKQVRAPRGKKLVWFDESAHLPQYEQPAAFRAALVEAFDGFRRGAIDEGNPQPAGARIASSSLQTPEMRASGTS